jgi:hypothetical protein
VVEAVAMRPIRLVDTASAASTVSGSSQVRAACAASPPERQLVGEEDRIEQRGFGPPRQVLVIGGCRSAPAATSRRMPPRRLVVAAAAEKQIEVQLSLHAPSSIRRQVKLR